MSDLHGLIDLKADDGLPRAQSQPRQRRLYEQLRAAILHGRLQPGAVLPSSRALALELGVARNTVIHAYEQLAAEGYVCAGRHGHGGGGPQRTIFGWASRLRAHAVLVRPREWLPALAHTAGRCIAFHARDPRAGCLPMARVAPLVRAGHA